MRTFTHNIGALFLGFVVAAIFGVYTASAVETKFGGVIYTWPSSHGVSGKLLTTNGSKTLAWDGAPGVPSVPAGIIMYTNGGACPTGWAGYGDNGEYFVGLVTTLEGQVGTDLSASENRATGIHTHTHSESLSVNVSAHGHVVTDPGHSHGGEDDFAGTNLVGEGGGAALGDGTSRNASLASTDVASSISLSSEDTAVSVTGTSANISDSTGTTGTNAPYVILRACRKS